MTRYETSSSKVYNMSNSSDDLDKGIFLNRKNKTPLINPNGEEQIRVLLHLLMRARLRKLDILAICWEDEDSGKSAYADLFDLPRAELTDMLGELKRTVTLA